MKPEERKTKIVGAAAKCFAERGYHATQVSDIIEAAGIARGTFYLYFKSKHEVFDFILDDFISHLAAQIRNIELGVAESPAQQMRGNVERVVDAIFERPAIGKVLFNEAVGLDREVDLRLKAFYSQVLGIIESSVRRGISMGLVRDIDPSVAACIVLGAFREIIVQNSIFKNTKIGRDAMIDGLIDALLGGLSGKPALA